MLDVELLRRDFGEVLGPQAELTVRWHSWHAIGGPEAASITLRGDTDAVAECLAWLRRPVVVYNRLLEAVWWGFVYEVDVTLGGWRFGVSLREVANRVRCRYTSGGSELVTSWAETSRSRDEFGAMEREVRLNLDEASLAQAEALRDRVLNQVAYPVPTRERVRPGAKATGSLTCRGWWHSLGWQYYENAGTATVDNGAQISTVAAAAGEFLTGVETPSSVGVSGPETRDGKRTGREIVEELLGQGTSSGRRLLATVTPERRLQVTEEPESGLPAYELWQDGSVRGRMGAPLAVGLAPVGVWAADVDVLPGSVDLSYLGSVSPVMIERSEWRDGAAWPEARDVMGAWQQLG